MVLFFLLRREVGGAWFRITHGKIGLWRRLKARRRCPHCWEEQNIIEILLKCSRCGSGALCTQGLGLQLSNPPPKHKLKTTDFVNMLTSRIHMIYASASVSHWNQLIWNIEKYNNLQIYRYLFSFSVLIFPVSLEIFTWLL